MIGDAPLHRWKDVLPEQIPHASDVVLGRAGTASVRAEEGRSVFGRESLQREHEQPGSFPLADVPFREPPIRDSTTPAPRRSSRSWNAIAKFRANVSSAARSSDEARAAIAAVAAAPR